MNVCDRCGKRGDFNTEIRIAPIDQTDKLIWGRIRLCYECRQTTTVDYVYNCIFEKVKL